MPRQLSFDLPARPALGRDDFFVSPANAEALATVEGWRDWPGGKLVLVGPQGAGKTHLAHVWAALSGARIVAAAELAAADIPALAARPVAVEDADRIAQDGAAEAALFHLHNLALAERRALLVTGRGAPGRWGLGLPDLESRLQAAGIVRLAAPDDALLSALLAKLFADRQLSPSPDTITYLTRRIDRSFAAAARIVAKLDRAALAGKRPVTRALAAEVLDET
ncbi:chromosomal replication initiator DnaA [Rhodosalinus sp. FB01]|uniref:chromosomal replication initiator DnaA n=1 Tax=Rhodosalinus sp. FB01 TaxID=3239194 RepID=UPI0035245821